MPHETEILFNEPGIQYQGVNDASGSTGSYPVQGLIIGDFRRGRTDKPMIIHKDNVKAMLGHDPENPSYVAVQDLLSTGVPNVQVLRLGNYDQEGSYPTDPGGGSGGDSGGGSGNTLISCDGATSDFRMGFMLKNELIESAPYLFEDILTSGFITINNRPSMPFEEGLYALDEYLEFSEYMPSGLAKPGYTYLIGLSFKGRYGALNSNMRIKMDFRTNKNSNFEFIIGDETSVNPTFGPMNYGDGRAIQGCVKPASEPASPPPIQCTPSIVPMNKNLMNVDDLVFRYSINGGPIYEHRENTVASATVHHVLVNVLAYSPAFLFNYSTNNFSSTKPWHFFISYDHPIQGSPVAEDASGPMTMELWATPGANNCLVTKAFGGDFVLRSCGAQRWTEGKVQT